MRPLLVDQLAAADVSPSVGEIAAPRARGGASVLAALGDRNLVFSEERQAVYELDDLAAYVWRSLESGMSADQIVREIIETGVDRAKAKSAVAAALKPLRQLHYEPTGATSPSSRSGLPARLTRLTIVIADVAVQLHLSSALVADVETVFGPLVTERTESDVILCARVAGSDVDFFSPGQPEWSCERAQFIPLLKAQLIESVLIYARYEVALHAAALAREHEAVLLVGSPGAGKTTLAIALAGAGLAAIADDVVLLDEHGLVTGIALPFAAKASSWSLLSHHWPGIADQPSHRRPDGQNLCYIVQDPVADPQPRRIGLVVLLDRQDQGRTLVEEVDPVRALSALVAEGATSNQRLSASGFTALVAGLREAYCCRLTYSDLIEAADAVRSLRS